MFSAKPYNISVIGEGELTGNDMDYIRAMVPKFTDYRTSNNLDHHRQYYDLPDGGYFVVQDMGGIFKVLASKDPDNRNILRFDGYAIPNYVPMLFSGDVSIAGQIPGDPIPLTISQQTRRRLIDYDPGKSLPGRSLELIRFNIEPNDKIVPELKDIAAYRPPTQYTKQRPTLYSGAMAEVIQIVGGYGKQPELLDDTDDLERKSFKIPVRYQEGVAEYLKDVRLPGYSGIAPEKGDFQYDYKFERTDGVAFDTEQKPWLIRVSPAGVFAMPLPIVPATATREFHDYISEVGDDEIQNILDRFGAMPSGEGFPIESRDFEAWRRAGVIIKICDTADFYSNIPYFSACGWSFNKQGTRGINTCYNYDPEGIGEGYTYVLTLDLGAARERGWSRRVELTGREAQIIGNYMSLVTPSLGSSSTRDLAILYKLRTIDLDVIMARADVVAINVQQEINYWENYEAEPIAQLNGNVARIYTGKLFHNAIPELQPQIKFPEIIAGGCVSFDFSPMGSRSRLINCDTIMFAAYIGDDLKVVKYFVDWRGYVKDIQSDFEPIMTVGSWEQIKTEGTSSIQGYFYITDFDFREIFSPIVTTTKIVGKDLGFESIPRFEFLQFFGRVGKLWRNRYYTHKTNVTRTSWEMVDLGVCIPMYDRNAMILAKEKRSASTIKSERLEVKFIQDPYIYYYWTYDPVFAWVGTLAVTKGKPFPVNGDPVWVEIEEYHPSPYNDFADQGPWIPGLPADYTWLIHPNKNEWHHSGGGNAPNVKTYYKSTDEKVGYEGKVVYSCGPVPMTAHDFLPDPWYFRISPDKLTKELFYRDACKVVFGDIEYASISESNARRTRSSWGHTSFTTNERAHHFIGVINE